MEFYITKSLSVAFAEMADAINSGKTKNAVIRLPKGVTALSAPVTFDGDAITAKDYHISILGDADGSSVLDGTLKISGKDFTPLEGGVYAYHVPKGLRFRNLYADGKPVKLASTDWYTTRVNEARFTDEGSGEEYYVIYVEAAALQGLIDTENRKSLGKDEKMDFSLRIEWTHYGMRAVGIDWAHSNCKIQHHKDGEIDCTDLYAVRLHQDDGELYASTHVSALSVGCQYCLKNNRAFLTNPNEFYYDEADGVLYYIPEKGKDIADITVGIPLCEQLLVLENIKNLTVRDITFTGTGSNYFTEHNHVTGQAGCLSNRTHTRNPGFLDHGALVLWNAKDIEISHCRFDYLEYNGIYLAGGAENVNILSNDFETVGAAAIMAPTVSKKVRVEDNYFIHLYQDYLTTGYGRIKAIYHTYEKNSVIFTAHDVYKIAAAQDTDPAVTKEYMKIDPDSFQKVREDDSAARRVYEILANIGCTENASRPLSRPDIPDLTPFYFKRVDNYKDAAHDLIMKDPTYKDGDNVYSK